MAPLQPPADRAASAALGNLFRYVSGSFLHLVVNALPSKSIYEIPVKPSPPKSGTMPLHITSQLTVGQLCGDGTWKSAGSSIEYNDERH
jgi:hypothetical protein